MNRQAQTTIQSAFVVLVLIISFIFTISIVTSIPDPVIETVSWENTKTATMFNDLNPNNVYITAPQDFTTCVISPDGAGDYDNCTAYILIENTFKVYPVGLTNYIAHWNGFNVKDTTYSYTKDFSIKDIDVVTEINETYNETYTKTLLEATDFSTAKPDLNKDESMIIKLSFQKKRWTSDSFNLEGQFGGTSVLLDPDVSACGTLDTADATYTLTQNISSTGTCFIIGANNITLDGAGFTVTYSESVSGYGIYNNGYDNIILNNFSILQSNSSILGNTNYGIYTNNMINSSLQNINIIDISDEGGHSFYLLSSNSNNITNNTLTISTSIGYGIYLNGLSNFNIISNNIATTTGFGSLGLKTEQSHNNIFINNTFNSSGVAGDGVYIYKSENNSFDNCQITGSSVDYHIHTSKTNNNFTNRNDLNTMTFKLRDLNSSFNYRKFSSNNIYIKTTISVVSKTITRDISNWTETSIMWIDNSDYNLTATYNLTGLLVSTDYNVTNATISRNVTTDGNGVLSVDIALSNGVDTTISVVDESYVPPSNTVPTLSANVSSPTTVYNNTDIKINMTITDPDTGDTLTGYVQFYKNGALLGSEYSQTVTNNTNTLIATLASWNYTKDDVIIPEIWAGDGTENTTKVNMTSITIQNSIPTIGIPTLNDSTPETSDTILCTGQSFDDVDGDSAIWYYMWYDSGSVITGESSNTLDLTIVGLDKDDTIICSTIASDGTANASSWKNTTTATIQNTAPTTPTTLTLTDPVYVTSTLTATGSGSTDADSDGLTYYYEFYNTNDAGIVQAYSTDNTYVIQTSDTHNDIRVRTKAYDGTVYSSEKETTRSVSNTAPTTTTPTLNPSSNVYKTTTPITCNNATVSDADNDVISWYYQWYIDDIQSVTTQTITNSSYSRDNIILCEIMANDGTVNSTAYNSSSVTILNTAPTTPDIAPITNANISIDYQLITCDNSTDVDTDTIYYMIYGDTTADPSTVLQNTTTTTYNWTSLDQGYNYFKCQATDGTDTSANTTVYNVFVDTVGPVVDAYYQWTYENETLDLNYSTDENMTINWNVTDISGINVSSCKIYYRNYDNVSDTQLFNYVGGAIQSDMDSDGYRNVSCSSTSERLYHQFVKKGDWLQYTSAIDRDSFSADGISALFGSKIIRSKYTNHTTGPNKTILYRLKIDNESATVAPFLVTLCNTDADLTAWHTDSNCIEVGAFYAGISIEDSQGFQDGLITTDSLGYIGTVNVTETMYAIGSCPDCTNAGNAWNAEYTNLDVDYSYTSSNDGASWTNVGWEFNTIAYYFNQAKFEINLSVNDNLDNNLNDYRFDFYGDIPEQPPAVAFDTDNVTGGLMSYYDIHGITESGTIWFNASVADDAGHNLNCTFYLLNNDSSYNSTLFIDYEVIGGFGTCAYEWNTTTVSDGDYRLKLSVTDGILTTNRTSAGYLKIDNTAPTYSNFVKSPIGVSSVGVLQTISLNVSGDNIDDVWMLLNSINYTMITSDNLTWLYSYTPTSSDTQTYQVFMNDTTGNINSTNSVSFDLLTPSSGGSSGTTYSIPKPIENITLEYIIEPLSKIHRMKSFSSIEDYFIIMSNQTETMNFEMNIECFDDDDSCQWVNFINRRKKSDGTFYNEIVQQKYIYMLGYNELSAEYIIDIPSNIDNKKYKTIISLKDDLGNITRIELNIYVLDTELERTFMNILDKDLFTIKETSITDTQQIKAKHVIYSLGLIGLIGIIYKIYKWLFGNKK